MWENDIADRDPATLPDAGWFIFHSMHSLCGIIGSCRNLLTLTLYMPIDSAAWAQSLCQSLVDVCPSPFSSSCSPSWILSFS
jgi:hypothetical protein